MIKDAIGTPLEIGDHVAKASSWDNSISWERAVVVDLLPHKPMSVELEVQSWNGTLHRKKVYPKNVILVNTKGLPIYKEVKHEDLH